MTQPLSTLRLAFLYLSITGFGQLLSADVTVDGRSQVVFASEEKAREILTTHDEFVKNMSPVDRQLRLQANRPVDLEEYLKFVEEQATEFRAPEIAEITAILASLRPQLRTYQGSWPDTVTFVRTTGREENKAPHCRGNAIILPASRLGSPEPLRQIIVHELFHILSRQPDAPRKELYSIVGFDQTSPIPLPQDLLHRKITNPDAPTIDCVLTVGAPGKETHFAPVLTSKQANYETLENTSLFKELVFQLMPVTRTDDRWRPADETAGRRMWNANEVPELLTKAGRNTTYIIHPEEILADNFAHLVLETPDLPDPWVVQAIDKVLRP